MLPFSAGAHGAAGGGSLAILRFPDAPSLGVVYLEALSGGVYLESQADVARYIRAFALLRSRGPQPGRQPAAPGAPDRLTVRPRVLRGFRGSGRARGRTSDAARAAAG